LVEGDGKGETERKLVVSLSHRIFYVQANLLATIRHTALIFPIPHQCAQQIIVVVVWYIWRGSIIRVIMSTLQRRKEEGWWGMIDVAIKCRALLFARMWARSYRKGCAPSELLQYW
jgi:hypothetical protein